MKASIRITAKTLCRAGRQILSSNIEAYENTIPAMLSDRLRNPKFAGPENPQTGIATEWEPAGNTMTGFSCRLVPGMYLSGREAQLIHNYQQGGRCAILQAGVHVRKGEEFEVEMWARAQHQPVTVSVDLRLPGQPAAEDSSASMTFDLAHWHRRTCRLRSPATSQAACFHIGVPGDSRIVIDQVHLRPVGQTHVSRGFLESFDHFPCPVLRFPGGCVSCTYHWEHGIGQVHLRPICDDPVFKYKLYYDFGTDEYLELCAARGIRPMITLNTSTATPQDAAAWAAYMRNWYASRKLAIPSAYFIFGNENYWYHELGHMTADMYVAQLKEFVPPVRAVYPEARIMALGEFDGGGLREGQGGPWRAVIIEKARGLFDSLVVTRYSVVPDNLPLAKAMEAVADNLTDRAVDLQQQAQTIRDAKLDCTMGIVEWNYWTRASHNDHAGFFEPNDIRHCLYSAGYINALCRMGEVLEVANFYSLVNTMGSIWMRDGVVELSDLVKVFNLYGDALPGDVLQVEADIPALTAKSRAVDACFIRKDGSLFAFLANFCSTDVVEMSLEGIGSVREAIGLSSDNIRKPVMEFTPAVKGSSVTLPPMSIVRLQCDQRR